MQINYFAAAPVDIQCVAELLKSSQFQSIYSKPQTVQEMRQATQKLTEMFYQAPAEGVAIVPVTLGGVACETFEPRDVMAGKVVLLLHGGGFVRGSIALNRPTSAQLAARSRLKVVMAAYRQAPEYPYPAASQDMLAVYQALLDDGYRANDIVVAGESAGGCLALTLPAWLSRQSMPLPHGLVGLSPTVDLKMRGASWYFNAKRDIASREMAQPMFDMYIDEARRDEELVTPIAGQVAPSTPMLLLAGANETLLSDIERFAHRVEEAGAPITLNLYEGMPHGFTRLDIPLARKAIDDIADWCAERFLGG